MKIALLNSKFARDTSVSTKYNQLKMLLQTLGKRKLPEEIVQRINHDVSYLNNFEGSNREFRRELVNRMYYMTKMLEKKCKLVPKKYYANLWRAYGMAFIGIPIGVFSGFILKDVVISLFGIPIGFILGSIIGTRMDKKALSENRQLDIDLH